MTSLFFSQYQQIDKPQQSRRLSGTASVAFISPDEHYQLIYVHFFSVNLREHQVPTPATITSAQTFQSRVYERRGPTCASQPEVSMDNISVTSAAVKATVKWFENPAVCGQTLTQVPWHDTVTVVDYIFMQWRKYSLCWITTEKNPPVHLTL